MQSNLREKVLELRDTLKQSVLNHQLVQGEREHARGWFNAYAEIVCKLDDILRNVPELDCDVTSFDNAEKRAMRSAVAWYVTFLERERDNRG